MDVEYTSNSVQILRRKKLEDVAKRAEYRKAHGLDDKESGWGWGMRGDNEGSEEVAANADAEGEEVGPDGEKLEGQVQAQGQGGDGGVKGGRGTGRGEGGTEAEEDEASESLCRLGREQAAVEDVARDLVIFASTLASFFLICLVLVMEG